MVYDYISDSGVVDLLKTEIINTEKCPQILLGFIFQHDNYTNRLTMQ